MEDIIIGLSYYNSTTSVDYLEFDTKLKIPVQYNDLDTMVVKNVFLDARLTNSNSVIIENDLDLSLSFAGYWINNGCFDPYDSDKISFNCFYNEGIPVGPDVSFTSDKLMPQSCPDGLPYILTSFDYSLNKWGPHIHTWSYRLPAGAYSYDELAELLTVQMSKQPQHKNTVHTGPQDGTYDLAYFYDQNVMPFIFDEYIELDKIGSLSKIVMPRLKPSDCSVNGAQYMFTRLVSDTWNEGLIGFDSNQDPVYFPPGNSAYSVLPIYYMPAIEETEIIATSGNVGATEISLVWNDQNNGVFEFQYTHTPLQKTITSGGGMVPVYAHILGRPPVAFDDPQYYVMNTIDKQSGILFTAMEPFSFWHDTLGFDVSAIAVPKETLDPTNIVNRNFTFEMFNNITTGAFAGTANTLDTDLVNGGSSQNPDILQAYVNDTIQMLTSSTPKSVFWESDSSRPLLASRAPLNSTDAGHYLVCVEGYDSAESNFINEVDKYSVKAIISSYYVSPNSFISSPFPDSYVNQHHGDARTLSNIKVTILNPLTMQKPLGLLGPNNSIYLQLTKKFNPEEKPI